jgi:hypothetical protein
LSRRIGFTSSSPKAPMTQDELAGYIKLGKMMDPLNPWDEIERIASTFQKQAA